METFSDILVAKSGKQMAYKYYCEKCHYRCCKKYNWEKHISTSKHVQVTEVTPCGEEKWQKNSKQLKKIFSCNICNKKYMSRNGLWKHKMKCKTNTEIIEDNITTIDDNRVSYSNDNKMDKDELILRLLKQNSELLELMKNGTNNCNNTTHVNSHNKTFNLQVFLNETCKDAMNIMDFVDSIKLQLSDLERIGEIGYAQGISDIITSNLQALDVTQRPVHCTDKKRETMYIKHDNEWTKEDDNKTTIRKMIKNIENKNIQVLPQFRKKYPNYADPKSRDSDKYNKTIIEAMGGIGGSESKENKIIRNISKVTMVREKE